jgi:receptor protein-tyrosine kinase
LKRPLLARVFGLSQSTTKKGNVVLVASDFPGAGKSFISFNLAVSIAQEQLTNVLLIDADPLRRNLTTALGQDDGPGFLQVLDDPDMQIDAVTMQTDIPGFRFVPAGQLQENATELLGGRRMTEILSSLNDPDTVVLLDSPPLLLTSESRVLADKVDHTLIVVEAGRSTATNIGAVLNVLKEVESTVSFVLNKAPASEALPEKGYHYNY